MDIVNMWINGCKILLNKSNPSPYSIYVVPRLVCKDGFSMSVQASPTHYSEPNGSTYTDFKLNDSNVIHTHFEIGFPNESESIILKYAEDIDKPTDTVYARVPLNRILKAIKKHGGLDNDRLIDEWNTFKGLPHIDTKDVFNTLEDVIMSNNI